MGAILGVDWGEKWVGIAIAYINLQVPTPLKVVSTQRAVDELVELCYSRDVKTIFLGLPLALSGEPTRTTEETLKFKRSLEERLSAKGLSTRVVLIDERMSSKAIERALGRVSRRGKAWRRDKNLMEAVEILSVGLELMRKERIPPPLGG